MSRQPTIAQVVLIAAAATAILRAMFVGATRDDVVFAVPALDGAFYHTWARSLAEGGGDFHGPYFLGPLYPHAIAWVYRILGPDPWHVRLLQSLLGVVDVALVTALGCRVFGRSAGAAAGACMALFGPLVFYEGILVLDVPLVTLTLAAMTIVVWRGERLSMPWAAVTGALLGLAILARPTAAFALPVALWALQARHRWRHRVLCVLACVVVVSPVVVRNARLGGGLAITTNGGVNFWAGNNADANGRFHAPPGIQFFTSPVFAAAGRDQALPPAVAARALTVRAIAGTDDAARSAVWTRAALDWMAQHPVDAAVLWARKAWLLLQAREVAQIESFEFHSRRLRLRRLFAVDFGWVWPLAAVGLWRARRSGRREPWVIAAFAAALLLPCLLFFVSARYRLQAVPPLALLAGSGFASLVAMIRARRWRALGSALVLFVPLAIATRAGARPPRGAAGWEHAQMAERLYAAGRLESAIHEQERAASILPDHPATQINLALYWHERGDDGDLERAVGLLRRVCARWPGHATARYNLGVVLDAAGDRAGAVEAWRATLEIDPGFQPARTRLSES